MNARKGYDMDLLRDHTLEMLKEDVSGSEISDMIGNVFRNIGIEDISGKIGSLLNSKGHRIDGDITCRSGLLINEDDTVDSFKITSSNSSEKEREFERFVNELL